jgi:drug/metabolite transporter (DMT)-like permease
MGIALSLAAMLCFATNILLTRSALARMPLESGFLVVLVVNCLFPAALFAGELALRAAPFTWDWKSAGLFSVCGLIGTILGRRMLFDAVRHLGPARASVFHSTAPVFALIGAWLLADERLGGFEIGLMALVWLGLWLTQPRGGAVGTGQVSAVALRAGMIAGLLAVAGFGFSNVLRGIAMRSWHEAALGAVLASITALLFQAAVTRDWADVRAQLRAADRGALWLYIGCGVSTSLGAICLSLAMTHMEIALVVMVVHTTPLAIFPVSVFVLKNREELSGRTIVGAALVLAGVAALPFR